MYYNESKLLLQYRFDISEKYSLSHEGVLTILNGGIIVDGDLSGGV